MKILLTAVNAKYIHSNPAIYSLAGYVNQYMTLEEKEVCQVEIVEYTINHRAEQILADLYKKKPDILAFSCYIWNWDMIQELITEIHKLLPNVPIRLGGPEVSFTSEKILEEYSFLTGIMVGEGEQTFLELCRFYIKEYQQKENKIVQSDKSGISNDRMEDKERTDLDCLENISGVVTGNKNHLVRELTTLDSVPFFYENMETFEHRIVYYESSRGCPYRCSYCLSSIDKTVRLRSLDLVKKELQFFLDKQIPQVKFIDRTFNCNHAHAMAIWQYILEHDNGITNFHFEVSADILNEEELEILEKMRPGLVQLEIGVQSTNPITIQAINRRMNVEKLRNIVARIHKAGNIHQHLDLIAGLPYEDYSSFAKSFNEVYFMRPQQLQLGFLKVLKGSEMWKRAEEYGIVYTDKPPYEVLFTNWLSYEEVLKLKQIEEMVEQYYNSNQFTYTIAMLEQEFASPFQMYDALACFYEKKGYALQNPARSYRYQILLDFAKETAPEKERMYRELLTFDIYLREKMKTRPVFAKSQETLKEISRKIYQKEEEERTLLSAYEAYNSKQLAKMTHLEEFEYQVWDKGNCEKLQKPQLVLFDYQERNALTCEARVIEVDL